MASCYFTYMYLMHTLPFIMCSIVQLIGERGVCGLAHFFFDYRHESTKVHAHVTICDTCKQRYEIFCSATSLECSIFNADITNSLLSKDDSYRNWPEFVPWFIGKIKIIALVAILHRFTSRCFCKICTLTNCVIFVGNHCSIQ